MLVFRDAAISPLVEDYRNSVLTKEFGVASFTILVWDHITTFDDEVELIWEGNKGLPIYLFFVNRYLIPLSFIVNLWAYFRTGWTETSCENFVRFEGAMTMIGISIVALMMFLRIRALYGYEPVAVRVLVQGIVITILLTFIVVNSWVLTYGTHVIHPAYPLVESCTMIFDSSHVGHVASSSTAWLPLLYDTVVVALTIYKTAPALYNKTTGQIFLALLEEGLLYYSVICTVTLALTIMLLKADQSVRNVTAQLELCLTVAMMSRITLHLRREGKRRTYVDSELHEPPRRLDPSAAPALTPLQSVRVTSRRRVPVPSWSHIGTSSDGESFAMEPLSSRATSQPSSGIRASVTDRPAAPVTIDLDVLHTPSTRNEELVSNRGGFV